MIYLESIEDKKAFQRINQKYLYEMTQFYDNDIDENGLIHYGYLDSYFESNPHRSAFYIVDNGQRLGFALINNFSHLGNEIDYAMAEFTIFPKFRKQHHAQSAVEMLFRLFPGRWEIKYHCDNEKAMQLWRKMAQHHRDFKIHKFGENEEVLSFTVMNKSWQGLPKEEVKEEP